MAEVKGKRKISIMGDSISTFEGYNPPNYKVYYTLPAAKANGLESVDDTWWKKVIDGLGGELCVNNSYSGSTVVGVGKGPACSQQRCEGLHRENNTPDIILVYMGTNDRGLWAQLGLDDPDNTLCFYGAYRRMLKQIKDNYPQAKIVCATVAVPYVKGREEHKTTESFMRDVISYNDIIKLAVKEENCLLADIAETGVRYESLDGCHPTKRGHATLAKLWLEKIPTLD